MERQSLAGHCDGEEVARGALHILGQVLFTNQLDLERDQILRW